MAGKDSGTGVAHETASQPDERNERAKLLEAAGMSWGDARNQTPLSNSIRASFALEKDAGTITQASLREDVGVANATLNSVLNGGHVSLPLAVRLQRRLRFNFKKATHPDVHGLLQEYMGISEVPGSNEKFKDIIRLHVDRMARESEEGDFSEAFRVILVQRASDELDEIKATKEDIEKKIRGLLFRGFKP